MTYNIPLTIETEEDIYQKISSFDAPKGYYWHYDKGDDYISLVPEEGEGEVFEYCIETKGGITPSGRHYKVFLSGWPS